jgi:uncharacterized protein involved in exopolysaccharide biosynthesis
MSGFSKKSESDIIGIFLSLWANRKRIMTNCVIAGVISIIVAFSIPKQYTSTVVMAPEISTGKSASAGLGAIASMAGVNLANVTGGEDAFYPEIYPQIVSSTPFLLDVLNEQVESVDGEIKTTLYGYLAEHQKMPWWSWIIMKPLSFIGSLFKDSDGDDGIVVSKGGRKMNLTKEQFSVLKDMQGRVSVAVDKGNFVITLNVTMQDQRIAAYIADVVSEKLQEYIADYRSAKARKDFDYAQVLFDESKSKYIKAQKEYADYVSQHQNVMNMRFQVEVDRYANEKNLAFAVYNQMAQSLEVARAKVQEETPVCAVVQPSYIQIKASSPKKIMLGLLFVFLAFFGTSIWIIVKSRMLNIQGQ